ncbi:MAG: hypothetical protein HWD61_12635 [Parachlamydiaceae bacterium]|nr:MAG: hypothetical protein HWD61_12635 [Parachlamydiaceae bacterium]
MKLYTYDSSFEEKLKEIKSHYKDCSFKGAVQPMMYGHQWQYIGEIQGTLTDEAYQDLKIKTYLKIIFLLDWLFVLNP